MIYVIGCFFIDVLTHFEEMPIDPMVPNRSKVLIEPRLAWIENDSAKRQSIDQRSTLKNTGILLNFVRCPFYPFMCVWQMMAVDPTSHCLQNTICIPCVYVLWKVVGI